jgi:hypothetical protein
MVATKCNLGQCYQNASRSATVATHSISPNTARYCVPAPEAPTNPSFTSRRTSRLSCARRSASAHDALGSTSPPGSDSRALRSLPPS